MWFDRRGGDRGPVEEDFMKGFVEDIEDFTVENAAFRRVLYTGEHL
jgi:hypothetical protein